MQKVDYSQLELNPFLVFSEEPTLLSVSGLILTTAAIIVLGRSQSQSS